MKIQVENHGYCMTIMQLGIVACLGMKKAPGRSAVKPQKDLPETVLSRRGCLRARTKWPFFRMPKHNESDTNIKGSIRRRSRLWNHLIWSYGCGVIRWWRSGTYMWNFFSKQAPEWIRRRRKLRNTPPLIHMDLGLGPLARGSQAQGEGAQALVPFLPLALFLAWGRGRTWEGRGQGAGRLRRSPSVAWPPAGPQRPAAPIQRKGGRQGGTGRRGEAAPWEDRKLRATGFFGDAAGMARGQGGGAAEWDEGSAVDVEGRRGEACGGRTQAEAEAAMEGDSERLWDAAILEGKWGGGGICELRRRSGSLI